MLAGGGRVVHDEVHQLVDADVAEAGGEEHGEKLVFADRFVQRWDQILFGNRSLLEEFFHQFVFALGDQLDQPLMSFLGNAGHVGGDRAFLALAISAHVVGVGLHADEINDASETLLSADRELQRSDGAAERVGERFEHAVGVGAIAIHTVDDDHSRQVDFIAVSPDTLSHNLDSGNAVHDDERRVDHGQHHLGLVDEHVEAGSVEQIDFDLLRNFGRVRLAPLDKSEAGPNRHLAGDFFFVVIGGGGSVVDASEARRGAGGVEHGRHQGSLAGMPVSDEGKIAEISSFVHFHGLSPSAGLREG